MDIEDCIEYASDVINVDEARTELADMRAKLEQWPVKWKASIDSYSNLLRESQEEITRLKAALNYIAAHGMGSSNDGAVHLGEHAYKALYPAIDDAFCMCGHRDSQHDGEEVCQVNGCMWRVGGNAANPRAVSPAHNPSAGRLFQPTGLFLPLDTPPRSVV